MVLDQNGKIRIWDTTQKEHILKKEYQFLSGPIRDIGWSTDNQRLAVVGEGRERYVLVFENVLPITLHLVPFLRSFFIGCNCSMLFTFPVICYYVIFQIWSRFLV